MLLIHIVMYIPLWNMNYNLYKSTIFWYFPESKYVLMCLPAELTHQGQVFLGF